MQITKNRIRRNYAPLNAAVSVAVVTAADSGLTQVYDESLGTWQPNREVTATVLLPRVTLTAEDGSLAVPLTNRDIAADTMKWLLDGKDILQTAGWKEKVKVSAAADETRGKLTIGRNVEPGARHTLRFECRVADTRTGRTAYLVTEELILTTTDKAEDDWSVGVTGRPTGVVYDQTADELAEMEYENAHGLAAHTDAELRAAREKQTSYACRWGLDVRKGSAAARKGEYEVAYYVHEGAARVELTEANIGEYPIMEMTQEGVTADLRLADSLTLTAEIRHGGKTVAAVTVGAARRDAGVQWDYLNQTDAGAKEDMREDRVLARTRNGRLKHPQRTQNIVWYVTDADGKDHEKDFGEKTQYSMEAMGLTGTAEIAEYVATEPKPKHKTATDGGAILTDGDGRELVFTGWFR